MNVIDTIARNIAVSGLTKAKALETQIGSFTEPIIQYATKSDFPATGNEHQIYLAQDSNTIYTWNPITHLYLPLSSGGAYVLPVASETVLGGIKIGENLTILDGVLKALGDTKDTAGATDDQGKLFIVGAKQQGSEEVTFSQNKVYMQNNTVYSGNEPVITNKDNVLLACGDAFKK